MFIEYATVVCDLLKFVVLSYLILSSCVVSTAITFSSTTYTISISYRSVKVKFLMEYSTTLTELEFRQEYGYQKPASKPFSVQLKESVRCHKSCLLDFFLSLFPIIKWIPKYRIKTDLPGDIIGGITTAIIRIPQSLAYGLLAGLDPINGMYVAFFAPLTYLFLGTSKHVSVGTFAVISLMIGSALDKYLTANPFVPSSHSNSSFAVTSAEAATSQVLTSDVSGSPGQLATSSEFVSYKLAIVTSLTILTGIVQICLGLLRLGFVALFLSDPVVAGFTTGAAVFVVTAQVKYFFGIPLQRHSAPFALVKTYVELFSRIGETQPAEVILSVITIAIIYPVKLINQKYKKKLHNIPIPIELIVVVISTIVSTTADLHGKFGISVVGAIPAGLPSPRLPSASTWPSLIADAFSISIVSFAITVSVGKLFAKNHGYKILPNQELFALGLSQITCGVFQGHACSGALARSTVKESSGTKTQFSDFVSCVVILLVLLLIGQYLSPLPVACLSSIILVNLRGLLKQVLQLPKLWDLSKPDFVVWVVTFVAVLLLGVDLGLAVGVLGLLVTVVLRVYKPQVTVRGALGNTDIYRDIEKFEKAQEVPGVKVVRFPQSPFFGNVSALERLTAEALNTKYTCDEGQKQRGRDGEVVGDRTEQERSLLGPDTSEDDQEAAEGHTKTNGGRKGDVVNRHSNRFDVTETTFSVPNSSDAESLGGAGEKHLTVAHAPSRDAHPNGNRRATKARRQSSPSVSFNPSHCFHTMVFDCSGWTFIDVMGMDTVRQVCQDLKKSNLNVYLASVQPGIMTQLTKVGVIPEGDDCEGLVTVFPSVRFAVEAAKRTKCHRRLLAQSNQA